MLPFKAIAPILLEDMRKVAVDRKGKILIFHQFCTVCMPSLLIMQLLSTEITSRDHLSLRPLIHPPLIHTDSLNSLIVNWMLNLCLGANYIKFPNYFRNLSVTWNPNHRFNYIHFHPHNVLVYLQNCCYEHFTFLDLKFPFMILVLGMEGGKRTIIKRVPISILYPSWKKWNHV